MYTAQRGNLSNLRRLAYSATPAQIDAALSWYPAARIYCTEAAGELGVRAPVFTAVTAAISCMRSWVRNIADAVALTTWYAAGLDYRSAPIPAPAGYGPLRMAYRVLRADDPGELSGPKVRAFFACIIAPECDEVVIDSHAYAAWIGSGAGSLTFAPGARRACAADYRALARELQMPVPATQALVWIVHKAQ